MPIYVYETVLANGKTGPRFEILQKISDPPLTVHPETGKPVRRVLQPPHAPGFKYDRAVRKISKEDRKKI